MDENTKQISKDLSQEKTLVKQAENKISQDNLCMATNNPEHLKFMLNRFKSYSSDANRAQKLVQPIVKNNNMSFSVRQEAELYLNKAVEIQELYPSS